MQETTKVRQSNLESLKATHRTMLRDSRSLGAPFPSHLQQKMEVIELDWAAIQELLGDKQKSSDFALENATSVRIEQLEQNLVALTRAASLPDYKTNQVIMMFCDSYCVSVVVIIIIFFR